MIKVNGTGHPDVVITPCPEIGLVQMNVTETGVLAATVYLSPQETLKLAGALLASLEGRES